MRQEPVMMTDPFYPFLHNELKPGEQLLWWGRPDAKHAAKRANTYTASYILFGLLTFVFIGLIFNGIHLILEEISLFGRPDSDSLFLLFSSIVLLAIPLYRLYLLYNLTQKHTNDLRQTIYGITNQRVLVITARQQGVAVNSYTQNDIGQINRVETGGGWGDVSYGKVRQIQRGLRTMTIVEKFTGIPNVHLVADILSRTFGHAAPSMPMQAQQYQQPPMMLHYEQPPQAPGMQETPRPNMKPQE